MSETVYQRVERFVRSGLGSFDELALEVFAHQFERNEPYQAFCRSLQADPSTVRRWDQIPAVPIRAFKSSALTTFPPSQASALFESSGTTTQVKSRHYLRDLSLYETAASKSFAAAVLADGARLPFLILTPPPGEAPRSSLVWMMDTVIRRCGALSGDYFLRRGRLDEPRLAYVLDRFQRENRPVVLLGTSLAFLGFFEWANQSKRQWRLAAGSRLMDTGGMKLSGRTMTRSQFVEAVVALLGIPETECVNEYGMTELSSQFYGRGASTRVQGLAWVRTQVVGEEGALRHFDLANVDSVMAIQTEDVGRQEGDGFYLLGRALEAEPRGCSLAVDVH